MNGELALKSLNYTIGEKYKIGLYAGFYKDSYMIFITNRIRYPIFEKITKSIMISIPTFNEIKFMVSSNVIRNELIPNIFTIDDFVYCKKPKSTFIFITRIKC